MTSSLMCTRPSMKNGRARARDVIRTEPGLKAAVILLFFLAAGCAAKFTAPGRVPETTSLKSSTGERDRKTGGGAIALFNRAQEKIRANEPAAAEALLRRAVSENPGLVPAHLALAGLYEKQKKKTGAVAAYRRVLKLRPGHVASHLALGRLAQEAGNKERAIYRYEEALRHDSGSFIAHYRLGLIRRRRGQIAMAVHHFKNAVRLLPGHKAAHYWLWLTLAERGGSDEYEAELGRGLVEAGNETPIRYYRGAAARHFRAGRTATALAVIQKAVNVNPRWRDRKWRSVLDDMARYRRARKK